MANLKLKKHTNLSTFRRMALGTWRNSHDPTVYGTISVRMESALSYIEEFRARTGKHLTITTLVGKAVARAFESMPDANAILRLGGIYLREEINLSFLVLMREGASEKLDLGLASVRDVDKKSLEELTDELNKDVGEVRAGERRDLEQTKGLFRMIPTWLAPTLLDVLGFLAYTANLDMTGAGIPKDPFGSATISNLGTLGLESGMAALVPYSRCPMAITVGAVRDEAVVKGNKVVPGKVMRIFTSLDHRIMDGSHAAIMAGIVRACLEDPYTHFDALPTLQAAE